MSGIGNRSLASWVERVAWISVTALVAGGVTWASWATLAIIDRPTRGEVEALLESNTPYIRDRALVMASISESKKFNERLAISLDNNTRAIIELQTIIKQSKQ